MSGNTISWTENVPAAGDAISLGPAVLSSLQSSLRIGLNAEHNWPSSTGVAGAHRQGSTVAFYGSSSKVSSTDTDGRLMVTTTPPSLWHVGSTVTQQLTSPQAVIMASTIYQGSSTTMRPIISIQTTIIQGTYAGGVDFPQVFGSTPAVFTSFGSVTPTNLVYPFPPVAYNITPSGCSLWLVTVPTATDGQVVLNTSTVEVSVMAIGPGPSSA